MLQDKAEKIKILMSEPIPAGPSGGPPYWAWCQDQVEKIGRPGTSLTCTGLKNGYRSLGTYESAYNGIWMAQRAFEAEKKGYDAFIVGCTSDLNLKECRALVNIPVIGPTEASVLLAAALGDKFSVILIDSHLKPMMECLIRGYGLIDKVASFRCPPGLTAPKDFQMMLGGKEKELADEMKAEMARAVNEDGAEALFVSCVPTGVSLKRQKVYEVEGAPVIDQLSASIKMAETLIDLKREYNTGVCKRSIYRGPAPGWDKQIPIVVE
jgi:allantoin racemase